MVWKWVRTFIQRGQRNASSAWHVGALNHSEVVNDSSFQCWARTFCLSDNCQDRTGGVLLWLTGLWICGQDMARVENVQGGSDAADSEDVSEVGKCATKIITEKNESEHKLWRVPASFCSMRFIKKARYLPGDHTLEAGRLNKPAKDVLRIWKVHLFHHLNGLAVLELLVSKRYSTVLSARNC